MWSYGVRQQRNDRKKHNVVIHSCVSAKYVEPDDVTERTLFFDNLIQYSEADHTLLH